jgi:pimeloyl-ACP methyl ester carboxylesterase
VTYEEFPVFVPLGDDHLCAVVCVPKVPIGDRGVVLLTGSNYTRTHRNRMWVRTARLLAEQGIPSIRFDYHGVGDSTGRAAFNMESPFDDDAVRAADFLVRATGVAEIAFVATCFGGRTAMAAAARHPKATSATLFPTHLAMKRPPGEVSFRTKVKRRIRKQEWGKKLFTTPRLRRLRTTAAASRKGTGTPISPRFKKDLLSFLARGQVQFIYGDRSETLSQLNALLADVDSKLSNDKRSRIRVDVLPDCAPEGFRTLADQDLAVQHAVRAVVGEPSPAGELESSARPAAVTSALP